MQPLSASPILVDQVYESLLDAIAEHRLPPGQRIRQGQLAASLGVSRQPVSHALQLLKHQGLVRETGRQGVAVAPLDAERLAHLYLARSRLDALAARLAAERVRGGDVSMSERAALRAVTDRGMSLDVEAPKSELVQADIEFHQALYALSGNPVILELLAPQWPHLRRSMMTVLQAASYRRRAWDEHDEIARHVLAGDAASAEGAASRHAIAAGEETALRLRST